MTPVSYATLRFLAADCAPDVLRDMCGSADHTLPAALEARAEPSRVPYLTETFLSFNLVSSPTMQVTTRGRACDCGIGLIEGASILEAIDRLREIDPTTNRITLVREGMTSGFIDLVRRLSAIRRVMICSPWVNLNRDRLHALATGIERSKREQGYPPEVTVVTRPADEQPDGAANQTLAYFGRIGAVVNYKPQLHSKLYIVECATTPAQRHAFVGSENFTKVRYQEVGIRINNDNQVVDDLVRYFLSLTG